MSTVTRLAHTSRCTPVYTVHGLQKVSCNWPTYARTRDYFPPNPFTVYTLSTIWGTHFAGFELTSVIGTILLTPTNDVVRRAIQGVGRRSTGGPGMSAPRRAALKHAALPGPDARGSAGRPAPVLARAPLAPRTPRTPRNVQRVARLTRRG